MEGIALPGGYQHPPGFRFHPSDQELILHYLSKKASGTLPPASAVIADIDLYKFNPWDLPDKALFGEGEWFFFSPRDRKYPNGVRPNRAAGSGYWKATGTDKPILASGGTKCIGVKKVLVFYKGRPPKGIKTEWVMHEYRLLDGNNSWTEKHRGTMRLDDWVLCRVQQKRNSVLLGEEKHESSSIPPIAQQQNTQSVMEKGNSFKWDDYQLLSYLMESSEENTSILDCEDKGSARSSGSDSNGSLHDIISGGCRTETQINLVSSDLQSIKRNLSVETLEDILLLPPCKRLNCSDDTVEEQPSVNGSYSIAGHAFYLD